MRIMQLGKSAAYPTGRNWNVSYLIDLDGIYLLIETPPAIANQLNYAGILPDQIDWIYISHSHGDHLLGLPMILVEKYARRSEKTINIVTHPCLPSLIKQVVTLVYPEMEKYVTEHTRFIVLDETNDFSIPTGSGFKLKGAYGDHGVPSMAVRVEDAYKSLVYSGDTAPSGSVTRLADGATALIHEAGAASQEMRLRAKKNHTTPAQAGEIAGLAKCGQLWLTHLEKTSPDFITMCVNEAMEYFDGHICVAPDFQWITI